MFRFFQPRLKMDDVSCPTNEELRSMGLAASSASDPRRRLFDLLDDACKFSPPNWLIEKEFRAIWKVVKAERAEHRSDPEDAGKTDRQLKEEYRAIAERRVRLGLVLAEIGMRNGMNSSLRGAAYENEVVDLIFGMVAADRN